MPLTLHTERTLKWARKDCCADEKRNNVKINIPEAIWTVFLTNDEKQTVILHNYVIWEVRGVRFIESQNNKIVILVPRKCP